MDSLKKQLQSAPATLSDDERASRLKNIDTKEKQLNRDAEDANTAYQSDLQEAYAKVAQKVSVTTKKYVSENGFTLLLDVSGQQSNVMWALPATDVTEAVIGAYNKESGIAAPPPSAPTPSPSAASASAPLPSSKLDDTQSRIRRRGPFGGPLRAFGLVRDDGKNSEEFHAFEPSSALTFPAGEIVEIAVDFSGGRFLCASVRWACSVGGTPQKRGSPFIFSGLREGGKSCGKLCFLLGSKRLGAKGFHKL